MVLNNVRLPLGPCDVMTLVSQGTVETLNPLAMDEPCSFLRGIFPPLTVLYDIIAMPRDDWL